jgi:hypothetical protein
MGFISYFTLSITFSNGHCECRLLVSSCLGAYELQESVSPLELLFSYLQLLQSDVKRGSIFKLLTMTINIINTVIENISNGISKPLSAAHL